MLSICQPIDAVLGGGLPSGAIINFYGAPNTGKSNIAFLACKNSPGKTAFIDTENGFSPERLKQIGCDLDNIVVFRPKTFDEQHKAVADVCSMEGLSLIVLDSAVALYRLKCSESEPRGEAKRLAEQLFMLSSCAREKDIPVLVTNHVYRDYKTGEVRQLASDSISYISKVWVYLEKSGKARKAVLNRHFCMKEGASEGFEITADGIRGTKFRIF